MARKLRSDEREAVNRQLPATVKRNLGGKTLARSRRDLARTPLGSPPVDYDVRSVYDVRPVAAFDFNIESSQPVSASNTDATVEMVVPDGFVAVLREADIWIEPAPPSPGGLKSNYTYKLRLNHADFSYNGPVSMGTDVQSEKFFMLANEGNTIGFLVHPRGPGADLDQTIVYARFRGTFQLKGEIPLPFEIANPTHRTVNKPRAGVLPVRVSPAPPAPPIPTTAAPPVPPIPPANFAPPAPTAARRAIQTPPFEIKFANMLNRGVQTWTPVRAKGGGYIPLTDAERVTYADFIATLRHP